MLEAPKIDGRSGEEIFRCLARDLGQHLGIDVEGGDPLAKALLRVFSRYCGLIIQRLNKVPDKNYAAFLNVLNVSPIPPIPAQVPLTFIPVKKLSKELPRGRSAVVVPAHTRVAAAPGEGESEPVIFETTRDLELTNIELRKVLALDPQTDLYSDKSSLAMLATPEGNPGEFAFDGKQPVDHEFYIGHGSIFGRTGMSELCLRFEMKDGISLASQRQAIAWWIPTQKGKISLEPVRDTTAQLTRSGEVVFENLPEWPVHEIFGCKTHWLGCRLLDRLQGQGTTDRKLSPKLPRVGKVMISAAWELEESAGNKAFFNTQLLDLSKDFFPLGERPRFGDVFYLSCDIFSKPYAEITLKIKLTNPASAEEKAPIPAVNKRGQPKIQWEYADGRRWIKLECKDETEALSEDGEISFSTPSSFLGSTINGQEGFWIRTRLISGHYGEDEGFQFTSQDQGLRRIPSTLAPPSIQSISVTAVVEPELVVTNNNFVIEKIIGAASFQPFRPALDSHPAMYLGFKVPEEEQKVPPERTLALDLYFHMNGSEGRASIRHGAAGQLPTLTWQYWDGKDWRETERVKDGTGSLTLSGIVSVRCSGAAPWDETSLAQGLYWFRVLWLAGEFECRPRLRRLLLNTVSARQTFTLQDETLGSSNGLPNQIFRSARTPILRDVQLEVREPDRPAEEERIYQEEGKDAVTEIRDSREVWVRWHEVGDFLTSQNNDRHFVVNRETDEIQFGDSKKGRIPAIGVNNVRLHRYQTGGGAVGNKSARSITQLRTGVPYVDSVMNIEAALGGQNREDWNSVRERGSRWLRHRERAVTREDYEDLARLASPIIARAKCYPNRDLAREPMGKLIRPGIVSVIIVPRSHDPKPLPDFALLRRVQDFLGERQTPDAEVVLLAPEYVQVSVEAVVAAVDSDAGAAIASQCETELSKYLHPLSGGLDGKGWEFGQRPQDSDLYALFESIRGLEYVRSLSIELREERPGLLESEVFLISAGAPRIRLEA